MRARAFSQYLFVDAGREGKLVEDLGEEGHDLAVVLVEHLAFEAVHGVAGARLVVAPRQEQAVGVQELVREQSEGHLSRVLEESKKRRGRDKKKSRSARACESKRGAVYTTQIIDS